MVTRTSTTSPSPSNSTGWPGRGDKRSALFNSGAEAVENAIKVARCYTRKPAVVAFDHAYHGRTNLAMALTAKSAPYKNGFGRSRRRSTVLRCRTRFATACSTKNWPATANWPPSGRSAISTSRSAPTTWRRCSSNLFRAKAASSSQPRVSGHSAPVVPATQRGLHRRRDPDRIRAHRGDVRLRARGH
ncbi:4-aminobutyrate transaminase [Mycobacterium xenopi 3993]|nr:4-aminobutyrate transaminase [Mycobacterium xenopi 3993]